MSVSDRAFPLPTAHPTPLTIRAFLSPFTGALFWNTNIVVCSGLQFSGLKTLPFCLAFCRMSADSCQ